MDEEEVSGGNDPADNRVNNSVNRLGRSHPVVLASLVLVIVLIGLAFNVLRRMS